MPEQENPLKIKPQPATERRSSTPKTLGRYRILHEVGRGATAFVYKAYDPQLDRFLAIKVLRKELARDKDYREAFLREARLAAQLTHPGIVTIFDVGIADDKPYIGMELLEGATLETVLKKQNKLNTRTVLAISVQLSAALNYAHKQGVVHRDIKPGNIVVLVDKKTVKLTDFGIAQLDESLGKTNTRSDKVLGTPEYMSPEQILGQPMDNRSDLYSLGVLIFQMVMGMPPFVSEDLGQLFKQIIKSKAPPLLVDEEKIKDDLRDLVRKLLQKSPAKRFQKASMVTAELKNLQNKIGEDTGKQKQAFVSLRFRWTAIMVGTLFAAMCVSLVIVYFVQNNALSGINYDYGRSIARMIAYESAESVLLEDKIGLNALVNESSQNEQLKQVYLIDLNDFVLASTQAEKIGQKFSPPSDREHRQELNNTHIYQRKLADNSVLFDIEMPINYAEKPLGRLYVTYSADSMYAASKTTLVTMLVVMMITLFVVFVLTLVLARRTSKDFQRVTDALNKMAVGRVDARMISERNDEVGQLFGAFNRLSEYLEHRFEAHKETPAGARNIDSLVHKVSDKSPGQSDEGDMCETVELDLQSTADTNNHKN